MLLTSQIPESSPESKAFKATVETFKISIAELVRASGVSRKAVDRFYKGESVMTTGSLTNLLFALTPTEMAFYMAMVQIQAAAKAGNVTLNPLDLKIPEDLSDIYRQAYEVTLKTFNLTQRRLGADSGIGETNLSNWRNGRKDCRQDTLTKFRNTITLEQDVFFTALTEVLFLLSADNQRRSGRTSA